MDRILNGTRTTHAVPHATTAAMQSYMDWLLLAAMQAKHNASSSCCQSPAIQAVAQAASNSQSMYDCRAVVDACGAGACAGCVPLITLSMLMILSRLPSCALSGRRALLALVE